MKTNNDIIIEMNEHSITLIRKPHYKKIFSETHEDMKMAIMGVSIREEINYNILLTDNKNNHYCMTMEIFRQVVETQKGIDDLKKYISEYDVNYKYGNKLHYKELKDKLKRLVTFDNLNDITIFEDFIDLTDYKNDEHFTYIKSPYIKEVSYDFILDYVRKFQKTEKITDLPSFVN